ncbi:MAG: hypothetical protein ACYC4K_06110 [Thiobacillus sp.]
MKMTPLEAINLNVTALDFPADEQFKADIEAAKAALVERNKPKVRGIDWSKMPNDTRVIYTRSNGEKSSAYIYNGGVTINPGWEGNDIFSITDGIKLKLCIDQPWIVWFGGECPVPEGVIVEMVLRSAEIMEGEANFFAWDHDAIPGEEEQPQQEGDIIAYRITGIADGWAE